MYGERKVQVDSKHILPEEKRKAKIESINVSNIDEEMFSLNLSALIDPAMEYIDDNMQFPDISHIVSNAKRPRMSDQSEGLHENIQGK